jgi:2-desacetyl-2-hydroxyethyl bacteriochlorophyllide A dehydrogenase
MKTRALCFDSERSVTIADRDLPPLGDEDLLVRVHAVGVCAGDLAVYRGLELSYPYWAGHEAVGTVLEIGDRVNDLVPGDAVALLGDGRFSELTVAHQHDAARIHGQPDSWQEWIAEPVACCVAACDTAGIANGDNVAVLGAGFMGLTLVKCLKNSPAAAITVIAPRQESLRRAQRAGADHTLSTSTPDVIERANALTVPRTLVGQYLGPNHPSGAYDLVFETSGTKQGMETASALTRIGGTLVLFGHIRGEVAVDLTDWHMRGLRVINASPMSAVDFRDQFHRTVALMESQRLQIGDLITHSEHFSHANRLLESSSDRSYVKGVLTF